MKRTVLTLLVLGLLVGVARASDRIAGFATIDKVVLERGKKDRPTAVQLWGTFTLLKDPDARSYGAPVRGYLRYSIIAGKESACLREWADLEKLAGTGSVVGFGRSSTVAALGKVRAPNTDPAAAEPTPYPLNFGLVRIGRDADWSPVRELLTLPAPQNPADGGRVAAGSVTLAVRNIASTRRRVRYVFELTGEAGKTETSTPVEPGLRQTTWTPRTSVKPGVKYRWRVWAVAGAWKGPVASARFEGKPRP
jgi:hypothetical protein